MDLTTTIIWWSGVILFTAATVLFYGLLTYTLVRGIWDYFKK